MDDKSIVDDFGVNYIIRGSMQLIGERARLHLEITDIKTFQVIVSKKRDFDIDEIFAVQDELSNSMLDEMQIGLGVGSQQGSNWASNFNTLEDFSIFLDWRNELRKNSKDGHFKAQKILSNFKLQHSEELGIFYLMDAWQIWQRIILKISLDPVADKKELELAVKKAVELQPNSPDGYNARAMIGITVLELGCEAALEDMTTAEKIATSIDTLTIGAMVYLRCGDLNKAIAARKKAIMLAPNDTNWVITGGLVTILFQADRIEEIYEVVGEKINSADMDSRVLAIYAILEQKAGNQKQAKHYLSRSIENGITKAYLESQIIDEKLRTQTIDELLQISYLE